MSERPRKLLDQAADFIRRLRRPAPGSRAILRNLRTGRTSPRTTTDLYDDRVSRAGAPQQRSR